MIYSVFFLVTITCITGLMYYKKFSGNPMYKSFIFFLCLTFLTEFLGNLTSVYYNETGKVLYYQGPVYNTFTIIAYTFFYWFYYKHFKKRRNKITVIVSWLVFYLYLFVYFVFFNYHFIRLNTNTVVIGSTLLLIIIILFLVEIVNNENVLFNITNNLIFWITLGLLLFYVGIIPIMIARDFLNFNKLYLQILILLNLLMYGSFIIGFIKSDPKLKY